MRLTRNSTTYTYGERIYVRKYIYWLLKFFLENFKVIFVRKGRAMIERYYHKKNFLK